MKSNTPDHSDISIFVFLVNSDVRTVHTFFAPSFVFSRHVFPTNPGLCNASYSLKSASMEEGNSALLRCFVEKRRVLSCCFVWAKHLFVRNPFTLPPQTPLELPLFICLAENGVKIQFHPKMRRIQGLFHTKLHWRFSEQDCCTKRKFSDCAQRSIPRGLVHS